MEVVAKNIKEQQEATNKIMNHKFQQTNGFDKTEEEKKAELDAWWDEMMKPDATF